MSSPTFDLVKEIIDIKIKPLVQEHGGIELKSVQGGTVISHWELVGTALPPSLPLKTTSKEY